MCFFKFFLSDSINNIVWINFVIFFLEKIIMFFRNCGNIFVFERFILVLKCNELFLIFILKGGILVNVILGS